MKELVSVIVPVYNVEKYLEECINSIIKQTYRNIEIILVDDGSIDKSGEICDRYLKLDERIKVIHKENKGLSDTRNVGIDYAKGKYICFIDSDDCIDNRYVEILYNSCVKNNCKISQCDYVEFMDGQDMPEMQEVEIKEKSFTSEEMLEGIYNENHIRNIIAVNKLYERELFNNVKYTVGKIHEDESTTYKLFLNCNMIAYVDKQLYFYRKRNDSITGQAFSLKKLDYVEALEERITILKNKNMKKLYALTLKEYAYILLSYYNKFKKYLPKEKEERKKLIKKYRRIVKKIIVQKNLKIKTKTIVIVMYFYPKLYLKMLEK